MLPISNPPFRNIRAYLDRVQENFVTSVCGLDNAYVVLGSGAKTTTQCRIYTQGINIMQLNIYFPLAASLLHLLSYTLVTLVGRLGFLAI